MKKKKEISTYAFVYHYWNINNLMSYYGYKEDWDQKKYSAFDIFVEHPLGENSTRRHYCGSIKQKRWIEACKKGEIYGEIIAVFTGENAGIIAHEYEHQMIITHKALYGQDTLYNKNDGYAKFSTSGIHEPKSEEAKKNMRDSWTPERRKAKGDVVRALWKDPEYRENMPDRHGENNGMYGKGYKLKGENNGMYNNHHSEATRQLLSELKTIWICPIRLAYLRNSKKMYIKDIAKELGVCVGCIKKNIKKYNLPKIDKRNHNYIVIDRDKLYQLYVIEKKTVRECAKIFGVGKNVINNRAKEYGFYERKTGKNNYNYVEVDLDKLYDLYVNQKMTIEQCSKELGCSGSVIWSRLHKFGISR